MTTEALDNISCDIEPVADAHLANKAYVDAAIARGAGTASVSGENVVSIPAHSLISCGLEPTEDSHLVNKAYVDAAVAAGGGGAEPALEPRGLGKVVYVTTLSDAATHTGTSLRDAINAVTDKGSVVIKFSVTGTITLEQGEIVIPVGNIAIDGENKITISGGGVSRVFALTTAYAVLKLYGLTITGGNGVGATQSGLCGGAIYILGSYCVLEARGVTFSGNSLDQASNQAYGGAIYASGTGASAYFEDCDFVSNYVTSVSYANGGAICNDINAMVYADRCRFTGNSVGGSGSYGGAVRAQNSVFINCVFEDNELTDGTTRYGGALSVSGARCVVRDCTFAGNSAGQAGNSNNGGGVHINQAGSALVVGCTFSGNYAYYGGALAFYGSTSRQHYVQIRKCVFDDNHIPAASGRGAAVYLCYHSAEIEDCAFINHTHCPSSGVVYTYSYTGSIYQVTVNRCVFTGNSGSGTTNALIYCANLSNVYVYNTVFTANSNASAAANVAALYTTGSSKITACHLTITSNTNFRAVRAASGSIEINNSVDVGNAAAPTVTNVTANNMLTNWTYGTGRIAYDSAKPLFAADGYTPVAGSQVIDVGDGDEVYTGYDLVGKPRVVGDGVDVGAVEWQG